MEPEEPIQLTPTQQRVVGALIEKELATPDNYPLSMNALLAACNQSTNRDPVMSLDEKTVGNTLENLKAGGVTRVVYSKGMRVDKYRHVLHEKLQLDQGELAVTAVLMLRGPQTLNELKTRTERLHPFADARAVESSLEALARREPALVELLPRQPGHKEPRWAHRLGPRPTTTEPADPSYEAIGRGNRDLLPRNSEPDRVAALEERIAALEERLDQAGL